MARRKSRSGGPAPPDPADLAWRTVGEHPLFSPLQSLVYRIAVDERSTIGPPLGRDGYGAIDATGRLYYRHKRRASEQEWAWVFGYLLLQLGLGHLPVQRPVYAWVAAADTATETLMAQVRLGTRPGDLPAFPGPVGPDVYTLFERWRSGGIPEAYACLGIGGQGHHDLGLEVADQCEKLQKRAETALAMGLSDAVRAVVAEASGRTLPKRASAAQQARDWLVSAFPLFGGLAAGMELVEDPVACRTLDIAIAAVQPSERVIYINPHAGLDEEELRFVVAHEVLHAGLRHDLRTQGRDPFLWNVACDYVINGWLHEMQLGRMPLRGVLHDPELAGLSAEEVYDRIANDLRRLRRLATLRGTGVGDIIEAPPSWWRGDGCDLDAFYRRALCTGLDVHLSQGRGTIPAAMIQAIRVLAHAPIPWDVALAQWFDRYFSPLVRHRTYARPSRRQASTPDLPRPRLVQREDALDGRTFGVVLDTSGSMPADLLGRALGAIASYAHARDVPAARVVFCDAAAYDAGYLPVASIADRVRVRGRGGTVLQPGITLLEQATDFPKDGPILIITDGECDVLRIRRDHAFLLPEGKRLPFSATGPIFPLG